MVLRNEGRHSFLVIICIFVLASCLVVWQPSQAKADDLPVISESGTLEGDETWTNESVHVVDGTVTVPDGVTLTIEAGTIVKYLNMWWVGGIRVSSGGALDVEGTSTSQVVFTSIKDDTVGGDSGGDGSSSPSPGDYPVAIVGTGGELDVEYASLRYATTGLSAECYNGTGASMTHNDFYSKITLAECAAGDVTAHSNDFDIDTGYAIEADLSDLSGIDLSSGSTGNSFSGSGQPVTIYASRDRVSSGESWTVTDVNATMYVVGSFTVDGSLTVDEGVVFKNDAYWSNNGLIAGAGGTLTVDGSTGSPVVFTSIKDDSIRGDSNGNGSTSASVGDYPTAITGNGAVTVGDASFSYASNDMNIYCNNGSTITAQDNEFRSGLYLQECGQGDITLERNTFDVENGYAIEATSVDPTGIVLSGADRNQFSGSGVNTTVFINIGEIPISESWFPDGSAGATLEVRNLTVKGVLNLGQDLIIKHNNHWANYGIVVADAGELYATGASTHPVTITSIKDDSIGGDSGSDGATSGAASDYPVAIAAQSGSYVEVAYLQVRYASVAFTNEGYNFFVESSDISDTGVALSTSDGDSFLVDTTIDNVTTGLDVQGYADVIFRGSITNASGRGIQACGWDLQCSVDAAYVDWGSATGPFVTSGTDKVCGKVVVSPWIYGITTPSSDFGDVANCDSSLTYAGRLSSAISDFHNSIASLRMECDATNYAACHQIDTNFACLGSAINVAASQSPFAPTYNTPTESLDTTGQDTADQLNPIIQGAASAHPTTFSPNTKILLGNVGSLFGALYDAYNNCH